MAKVILNNKEFYFTGYNRNTYFNDNQVVSNGCISGISGPDIISELESLGQNEITSIVIKNDMNETIYTLNNIHVKINSIDESYDGMNSIMTSVNIQFS